MNKGCDMAEMWLRNGLERIEFERIVLERIRFARLDWKGWMGKDSIG